MIRHFPITVTVLTIVLFLIGAVSLAVFVAITVGDQRDAAIVLYETPTTPFDLVMVDLSTGHQRTVAGHPATDRNAQWSPDGRTIVFESTRNTSGVDIYKVDVVNTTLTLLTHPAQVGPIRGSVYARPAWTRDGDQIIFIADNLVPRLIFSLDMATGNVTEVDYDAPGVQQYLVGINPFRYPAPNADGSEDVWAVYYGAITGASSYGLYLETADALRLLYHNDMQPLSSAYAPAWSPDGKKIAITAAVYGRMQVLVVDVVTATVTQITHDGGVNPKWRP